jgi:hypothetical protein
MLSWPTQLHIWFDAFFWSGIVLAHTQIPIYPYTHIYIYIYTHTRTHTHRDTHTAHMTHSTRRRCLNVGSRGRQWLRGTRLEWRTSFVGLSIWQHVFEQVQGAVLHVEGCVEVLALMYVWMCVCMYCGTSSYYAHIPGKQTDAHPLSYTQTHKHDHFIYIYIYIHIYTHIYIYYRFCLVGTVLRLDSLKKALVFLAVFELSDLLRSLKEHFLLLLLALHRESTCIFINMLVCLSLHS